MDEVVERQKVQIVYFNATFLERGIKYLGLLKLPTNFPCRSMHIISAKNKMCMHAHFSEQCV
jgi:hypothetical protein